LIDVAEGGSSLSAKAAEERKVPMLIFEGLVVAWMVFSLVLLLGIGQVLAEIRNQLNRKAAQRETVRRPLAVPIQARP
jgi:hypothetical protein